jgi:hypothetical protein
MCEIVMGLPLLDVLAAGFAFFSSLLPNDGRPRLATTGSSTGDSVLRFLLAAATVVVVEAADSLPRPTGAGESKNALKQRTRMEMKPMP